MNEDAETAKLRLTIRATDYASANLNARIAEFRRRAARIELNPLVKAIQFLRGVGGRASFGLTALYALWGAQVSLDDKSLPYWRRVQAAQVENASLMTLSLTCRAIFDDSRTGMTGKNFALISDPVLQALAEFYGKESSQPTSDALKALTLVKCHADSQAAHISLDSYLFHNLDLVHVVAAIAVVGAMIVDFDFKMAAKTYFDAVDEAAWQAATNTFPGLSGRRLFHNFSILEQVRTYWKIEELDGLNMLLNQLPVAIGYWDSSNEVPD